MLVYILKDVVRLRILRERVDLGLLKKAPNAMTSVFITKRQRDISHTKEKPMSR